MPALLRGGVINTTIVAGAVSVAPTGILLPANVPITVDVANRHSTPASLATINLTDSAGHTYTPEDTVTDGGGSPTRRLTRFRLMLSANSTGLTITATAANGIAQTELGIRVMYASGADVSGSNGSGAFAQTVHGNTAGGSATSIPPIAISMTPGDGAIASFLSGVAGAVTPRPGWTEIGDNALASSDLETQFRANADTAASASGSNGTWMGIVSELRPLPGIRPVPTVVGSSSATALGYSTGVALTIATAGGVVFKAGKTYYAILEVQPSGASPFPAVSLGMAAANGDALANPFATPLASHDEAVANGQIIYTWRIEITGLVDIPANVTLNTTPSTSGNTPVSFQIVEISNVDLTQGTSGEIQNASAFAASSAQGSIANAPFAKPSNFALLLFGEANATAVLENGWNLLSSLIANTVKTYIAYRETAPSPTNWDTGGAGVHGTFGTVIELAPLVIYSPPAVTLITPANGSTIAQPDSITIDVIDPDGDLSNVAIYENGTPVFTAGAYQSGYLTSTKTSLGSGNFRFVVTPTAWTPGSLGIFVQAQDVRGLIGTALFNFTVSSPATHAPAWTLVSPSNGSTIGQSDPIVIESTDLDDDLASVLATFNVGGTDELAHGVSALDGTAFGSLYITSSTAAGVTHGKRYTFRRNGGWTLGALSFDGTAVDAVANSTPVHYAWTVGGGGGGGGPVVGPIDVIGPGGLLFLVDERTAAVWHLDEPDGVQPSDAAGNVLDLHGVGALALPTREAGIVGHGRKWAAGQGMGAKDAIVGALKLTRTMAVEVLVMPNGDGTRTLVQRGLNDGSADERILWELKLVVAAGTGTLQMAWQRSSGAAATVPSVSFNLPPEISPWLYVAACRRWISATLVAVDYYVNGTPVGSVTSVHGDITDGDNGTVLVGVQTSAPTMGMVVGDIIDEIRISSGERTAEEIRQVFRRLFVVTVWARQMLKSFLPPGRAYSNDPDSIIQREVAVEGDGLAHAWWLAQVLLDDWWPDRATQTIERWETVTRQHPHPGDFYADRRKRVLARFATSAGYSREKIAEAIAPLLDCTPADITFVENSNRFEDSFPGSGFSTHWQADAGGGSVSNVSNFATFAVASGHDARWDGTHVTPARLRGGLDAWSGTEIRAQLSSYTLPQTGDMAGIFVTNLTNGDAHLFGARHGGSGVEYAHIVISGGVATVTSLGAITGSPYIRLHELDGVVEFSYSLTGFDGPWTVLGTTASIPVVDWGGVFLASGGAAPASGLAAQFSEIRFWFPESVRVFLWYVQRAAVGGNPDYRAAQRLLEILEPAHTLGVIFGTLFLTDDPNSLTDNQVLGS